MVQKMPDRRQYGEQTETGGIIDFNMASVQFKPLGTPTMLLALSPQPDIGILKMGKKQ